VHSIYCSASADTEQYSQVISQPTSLLGFIKHEHFNEQTVTYMTINILIPKQ